MKTDLIKSSMVRTSMPITLKELSSVGKFSNSISIMRRAVWHYREMIRWMEEEVAHASQAVSALLDHLPDDALTFVFRSGPIRLYADRVAFHLHSQDGAESRRNVLVAYADLCSALNSVGVAGGQCHTNWRTPWVDSGFDLQRTVSESFPYIVSAWVGAARSPTRWNEALSLENLFSQTILTAGAEKCVVRPLTEHQCGAIEEAIGLIYELCPEAAYDVVVNVRHISYIDYYRWQTMKGEEFRNIAQSLSRNTMPSSIFLSCHAFSSIDDLVESIYHESLHRKLANIILTHPILLQSYDWRSSPMFCCTWNRHFEWGNNQWPFDRALDAFHVYVHLYVLYSLALECSDLVRLSRNRTEARRKTCRERALALGDWLHNNSQQCMGVAGEELLDMLTTALQS